MTLLDLLRDAASRIVRAEESLEVGDRELAWEILRDLELDVVSWIAANEVTA